MDKPQTDFPRDNQSQQGFVIDPKRILNHAIRFWYLVLTSLAIAFAIAYVKNRYAVKAFPVSASLIIKESKETTEANLILSNAAVRGYRNYLNELYIIRSLPLLQRTVEEVGFHSTFFQEGSVLTSEIHDFPINALPLLPVTNESRMYFKALDKNTFELASTKRGDESLATPSQFRFGDSIRFNEQGYRFILNETNWEVVKGRVYLLVTRPAYAIASEYLGKLNVEWAEEGAGVINLTLVGSIPQKEVEFLSALVKQYQLFDLEKKNTVASRTIDFINDQLKGISDSLKNVEGKLQRFKDERSMSDISDKAVRYYSKVETIELQKGELSIRKNYYSYLLDYIKDDRQDVDQIIMPTSVGINDPVLLPLLAKTVEIQMQLRMNHKIENPITRELSRQLAQIKKDILEAVKNLQMTEKIRMSYLESQLRDLDKILAGLPADERQLVSIKRNYSLLENLYVYLLQKRAEAGISRASNTSDISVLNPPTVSGGPISINPTTNYVYALLLGLLLPISIFVAMEVLNTKIQSREDVEKFTSIPFIGGVGHKKTATNLEVLERPKTSIAESFRALRANLNFFVQKNDKATILVTSSLSGEGKTFTSINLASIFALSDKKVLIVGADMRRPKIYADFRLHNNVGLSNFLSGMAEFSEVIQKTSFNGLDLVSGGPVPPNPSELLLTNRMAYFIKLAKETYDFVIIDTPPIAMVSDALALSDHADHVLFIVRQNYTPKEMLKIVHDYYSKGKFTKISIVLNDIYKHGLGYGYGYGYRYPYSYGYARTKDSYYGD